MRLSGISKAVYLSTKVLLTGVAGAVFLSSTYENIAFQDVASLSATPVENRSLAHLRAPVRSTVVSASFQPSQKSSIDRVTTGSVPSANPANVVSEAIIHTTPKTARTPQTINRALKGARVVEVTSRQAPKNFSAGSILEQHSNLLVPEPVDSSLELAFVKPKHHEKVIQVATAFHLNKPNAPEIRIPENLPVMVAKLVEESTSSVLAYAPEPKATRSPFAAVLNEEPVRIKPRIADDDHNWADDPLPKNSFSKRQQKCLAEGIYFEARGESVRGQAAVSQVILNRVRNPHYPNTICGVVYQNKNWYNRCQFSFACDRIRDRVRSEKSWNIAKHVAAETTAGRIWFPQVGSSTHYHATYVRPKWARKMKRVGKVGLHIFYRTKRGGWS